MLDFIILIIYPLAVLIWLLSEFMLSIYYTSNIPTLKNINNIINIDEQQIKDDHINYNNQLNILNGTISSLNNSITNLLIDIDTLKAKIAHVNSTS